MKYLLILTVFLMGCVGDPMPTEAVRYVSSNQTGSGGEDAGELPVEDGDAPTPQEDGQAPVEDDADTSVPQEDGSTVPPDPEEDAGGPWTPSPNPPASATFCPVADHNNGTCSMSKPGHWRLPDLNQDRCNNSQIGAFWNAFLGPVPAQNEAAQSYFRAENESCYSCLVSNWAGTENDPVGVVVRTQNNATATSGHLQLNTAGCFAASNPGYILTSYYGMRAQQCVRDVCGDAPNQTEFDQCRVAALQGHCNGVFVAASEAANDSGVSSTIRAEVELACGNADGDLDNNVLDVSVRERFERAAKTVCGRPGQ